MSALGLKLRVIQDGQVAFYCPGCKSAHTVNLSRARAGACWTFNGNGDKPTFQPSIHVRTGRAVDPSFTPEEGDPPEVCHSFVTDGRIQFLDDCTHELAGKTVEIPDWRPL